ncbi:hypothetical protein D9758_016926 [Tetrapyrgos nigripes]|uniref:Uncharacterized protein n=1 Tax=Tetrapyrgos nigripes TaxID=182062 RepID=A0A8H5CK37_9AGAR|nr:hypothetical protein D9758_016926 [Tetrapyrgos nigripes]
MSSWCLVPVVHQTHMPYPDTPSSQSTSIPFPPNQEGWKQPKEEQASGEAIGKSSVTNKKDDYLKDSPTSESNIDSLSSAFCETTHFTKPRHRKRRRRSNSTELRELLEFVKERDKRNSEMLGKLMEMVGETILAQQEITDKLFDAIHTHHPDSD